MCASFEIPRTRADDNPEIPSDQAELTQEKFTLSIGLNYFIWINTIDLSDRTVETMRNDFRRAQINVVESITFENPRVVSIDSKNQKQFELWLNNGTVFMLPFDPKRF